MPCPSLEKLVSVDQMRTLLSTLPYVHRCCETSALLRNAIAGKVMDVNGIMEKCPPKMALVRSSRYSSRRSTNRAHNNTSTLRFLSLLQGTQTDRAGPPRCLRCATPSPGALTRSDRNLKHARNGASWRSTRQGSHSNLSVQLVANKTHTGLLPPRERLQPEESQARRPLLQSQRAQPR